MPTKVVTKSAGKKSWKDVQSKARSKRRSKLAIGILALILGFFILSQAIRFTQNLFAHGKSMGNRDKNYTWNGEFNVNLLVRTKTTSILSYNPKEEKITVVNIPDEAFIDVPYGFGFWQLRAIYGLGQSQKELGGNNLSKDALTSFLAVPIDGFLDFSELNPSKSTVEIVESFRKNPFSGLGLVSALKTDLTMLELFRLKTSVASVRFDKVKEIDLAEAGVFQKKVLADGTEVLIADPIKLDAVLSVLADPEILKEHTSIAVFNATDRPQLAEQWARLITNLGGNVVIMGNAKEGLKKTQVLGIQSATFKRLQQVFSFTTDLDCQSNLECDKISPTGEDSVSSRTQINLLLGEDFINR